MRLVPALDHRLCELLVREASSLQDLDYENGDGDHHEQISDRTSPKETFAVKDLMRQIDVGLKGRTEHEAEHKGGQRVPQPSQCYADDREDEDLKNLEEGNC